MTISTDAFTLNWAELRAYANLPWNLMDRVVARTHKQQADNVVVKGTGLVPALLSEAAWKQWNLLDPKILS